MSQAISPLADLIALTVNEDGVIRSAGIDQLEHVLCSAAPDELASALFDVTTFIGFLLHKGHTESADTLIALCATFAEDIEAYAEEVEESARARGTAGSKMMDAAAQASQVATGQNEVSGDVDHDGMRSVLERLKQQSAARKQQN